MEVSNDQATSTNDDKEWVAGSQSATCQQECSPDTVLGENNGEAPMSNQKPSSRRRQKQLEQLAQIRGAERQLHFDNGGSLHDWRGGLHTVTSNKKKKRNKRACRGKIKTDSFCP